MRRNLVLRTLLNGFERQREVKKNGITGDLCEVSSEKEEV